MVSRTQPILHWQSLAVGLVLLDMTLLMAGTVGEAGGHDHDEADDYTRGGDDDDDHHHEDEDEDDDDDDDGDGDGDGDDDSDRDDCRK